MIFHSISLSIIIDDYKFLSLDFVFPEHLVEVLDAIGFEANVHEDPTADEMYSILQNYR